MIQNKRSRNVKIIAGIAAGVSVGILAAYLLSDKGSSTRKKIADGFGDFADSVKDMLSNIVSKEQELVGNMADKAKKTAAPLLNTMS
jgi:gas vesicle protein